MKNANSTLKTVIFIFILVFVNFSFAKSNLNSKAKNLKTISLGKFQLDKSILKSSHLEFKKYQGSGAFDNYLAMNIAFEPMADLFKQLLIQERRTLTNRGEAHITVLTPPEYWSVFRPMGISIQDVNDIAEKRKIQSSDLSILCLGQGQAVIDNKKEDTFYVVIHSKNLLLIRNDLQKLLILKGGKESDFDPNKFFPHITLGFTKRDLHESDGIIKDEKSCLN